MKEYVLDASVAIKWFFPHERGSQTARKILRGIKEEKIRVFVPQIFFFEIINVVKTKSNSTSEDVLQVIDKIFSLDLVTKRIDKKLLAKANFYAQKYNLTIYDASYIALAKLSKVILVTADQKLVKKTNLKFIRLLPSSSREIFRKAR